ncbi:MAG: hypothetical protein DRJ52_00160 [Thermoprotei archaeon]|nr:MAG: hypothetical protein DRJ52_00160 [Thermoprotei archaeon]RLF00975.1 MAG: hypothetical protein DRJ63_01030 [Thermoprotei archaeon]
MPKDCRECIFFSNNRCLKLGINIEDPSSPPCLREEQGRIVSLSLEDLEKIVSIGERKPSSVEEVFAEISEQEEVPAEVEVEKEEVSLEELIGEKTEELPAEKPPVEIVQVASKPEPAVEDLIKEYNSILENLEKNKNNLITLEELRDIIGDEAYESQRRELEEIIEEQRRKLEELEEKAISKGAIKCSQCGALNLPNSKVCTRCGYRFASRAERKAKEKRKPGKRFFFAILFLLIGSVLIYQGMINGDWSYLQSLIKIPCSSCLKGLTP